MFACSVVDIQCWLEIETKVSLCEGHQLIKSSWWLSRFKFIAVVSVFRWLACKYFCGNKCCWRLFCYEISPETWKIPGRLCNRMETKIFAYFCVGFEGKNFFNRMFFWNYLTDLRLGFAWKLIIFKQKSSKLCKWFLMSLKKHNE